MTEDAAPARMRAEVAASWERSAAAGVEVGQPEAPIALDTSDVRGREAHPLARVFPLLDDVLGQEVRDCGAVMAQFEYWSHTHLTIDVVPGRGAGFSLEAPYGVRFLIRSRLLTDEESDGSTR